MYCILIKDVLIVLYLSSVAFNYCFSTFTIRFRLWYSIQRWRPLEYILRITSIRSPWDVCRSRLRRSRRRYLGASRFVLCSNFSKVRAIVNVFNSAQYVDGKRRMFGIFYNRVSEWCSMCWCAARFLSTPRNCTCLKIAWYPDASASPSSWALVRTSESVRKCYSIAAAPGSRGNHTLKSMGSATVKS